MRSGTGASVVNGRWAVDPPGEYQAGGTTFTYARPRAQAEGEEEKGESLKAPGPTTTQLQLYVSTGAQEGIGFNPVCKHEPGHDKMKLMIRIIGRHTCAHRPFHISSNIFVRLQAMLSCSVSRSPDSQHYCGIKTATLMLLLSHIRLHDLIITSLTPG